MECKTSSTLSRAFLVEHVSAGVIVANAGSVIVCLPRAELAGRSPSSPTTPSLSALLGASTRPQQTAADPAARTNELRLSVACGTAWRVEVRAAARRAGNDPKRS